MNTNKILKSTFKLQIIQLFFLLFSTVSFLSAQGILVEGIYVKAPGGMQKTSTMAFEDPANGDYITIVKTESEDITDKQHLIPDFLKMEIEGYEFIGVKTGSYNSKTLSLASLNGYGENKNVVMIHTILPVNHVTYGIMSLILIDEKKNKEEILDRLRRATNNLIFVWDQLSHPSLQY